MKTKSQKSSLVWLIFSLYICIESVRLPIGNWRDPGPGFLPLGSGIILAILSLTSYFSQRGGSPEKSEFSPSSGKWKNLMLVLAALFFYALALETLGFLLATFFLLFFLFRIIEPQGWGVSAGGSAAASFCAYMVFEYWLKTQLPKGVLGF